MESKSTFTVIRILAAVGIVALCRCAQTAPKPAAPALRAEVGAAAQAVLAQADRFDGQADHVVSRCAGCALHMDGRAEHALEVNDYSLHFCSNSCKADFSKDLERSIVALEVPEAPATEATP